MFSKIFSSKDVSEEAKLIINDTLKSYCSDSFPKGILSISSSPEFSLNGNNIVLDVTLPFPCNGELSTLAQTLTEQVKQTVTFNARYQVLPVKRHELPRIANIIAVSSGKGGVGKSTTAVNLAYALIAEGGKVGILDADIYGPSIPTMLGLQGKKPTSIDGKLITPFNAQGLLAMSIGFLVDESDATVWRGPMASRAFSQLLNETDWPELDYLIIDMPPGTGDIQLTLAQKVPVAAAVVVTTPQDIALLDAVKGIAMFEKVNVPVLGIIENMSYHICESCGHHSHLFGEGGGAGVADKHKTPLLGQLPLNISIREDADKGLSPLLENSTSEIALLYRKIARNVTSQLFFKFDARSPQTAEISFVEIT